MKHAHKGLARTFSVAIMLFGTLILGACSKDSETSTFEPATEREASQYAGKESWEFKIPPESLAHLHKRFRAIKEMKGTENRPDVKYFKDDTQGNIVFYVVVADDSTLIVSDKRSGTQNSAAYSFNAHGGIDIVHIFFSGDGSVRHAIMTGVESEHGMIFGYVKMKYRDGNFLPDADAGYYLSMDGVMHISTRETRDTVMRPWNTLHTNLDIVEGLK